MLDLRGHHALTALTPVGDVSGTASRPARFICVDSRTYWIKETGLLGELIAGRLADHVEAGPIAKVINVPAEAAPAGSGREHLQGLQVGTLAVDGTIISKDIDMVIGEGRFDPNNVDSASRARVIAFQTWLGRQGDQQVLVRLRDGRIFSVDHVDVFGNTADRSNPSVVVAPIDKVPPTVGKEPDLIRQAVGAIEGLDDGLLTEMVTDIPVIEGGSWRSGAQRRLEIAVWLAYRRDLLRGVIEQWLRS